MLYVYTLGTGAPLKMTLIAMKTYYYYTIQYPVHLQLGCFPVSKTFMHFNTVSNIDLESTK